MASWSELTHECLTNILARLSISDRAVLRINSRFDSVLAARLRKEDRRYGQKRCRVERGGVTEIRVRHCSDRSVVFTAESCPKLRVLSVESSPRVTDASMVKVAHHCCDLIELDISVCYEISHVSLLLIGRNCSNLNILKRNLMNWVDASEHARTVPRDYLNACPQDGDSEAAAIGKSMMGLEHLEVKFSKLMAQGLVKIVEGCVELQYLDLIGCLNLSNRDIVNATEKFTKLKVKKPNFYVPRSAYLGERYGHWQLYDERFQTDVLPNLNHGSTRESYVKRPVSILHW